MITATSSVEDMQFRGHFLLGILLWVSNNFDPEEIFTGAQLEKWAEDNDWIKE